MLRDQLTGRRENKAQKQAHDLVRQMLEDKKSFAVWGAGATGKSTLVRIKLFQHRFLRVPLFEILFIIQIPFIDQIKAGKQITVTDPEMTRFLMSLDEAVDLVMFAFENGQTGDIMVQKAPACTIGTLAQAVRELFHDKNDIHYIGIRHGEKKYETALSVDRQITFSTPS